MTNKSLLYKHADDLLSRDRHFIGESDESGIESGGRTLMAKGCTVYKSQKLTHPGNSYFCKNCGTRLIHTTPVSQPSFPV